MNHYTQLYIITTIKNLIILGFTAYVVFWMGYSGWWFLLAIILMSYVEYTKKDEDNDKN